MKAFLILALVGARLRTLNRPRRGKQNCVYFSQHIRKVELACVGIESYKLISSLFQKIISDLLLNWISVFVPVLITLYNQFVVNKIQINTIFANVVLSLDIQHIAVCI